MSGFSFKQLRIQHDKCAMKVGTDGILLGTWADVSNSKRICDLGTGTGLIALMLAQRTDENTQIIGVEIDPNAVEQAKENIISSKWKNKIHVIQQDIADFSQYCGEKQQCFDLIVANPPYFLKGVNCATSERNIARYTQQYDHLTWLNLANQCLSEQGKIQFILPVEQAENLIKSTALYCNQRCEIITKQGKVPHRMLLSFERIEKEKKASQLVIYDQNNQYTHEFVELTRDFYLKM